MTITQVQDVGTHVIVSATRESHTIKARLPAPRMCAPTGQDPLGYAVGLRPVLGLLARAPVCPHHLQTPLYPLSIHVHLVLLVD